MRLYEFLNESSRFIKCPFKMSLIKMPLYHGTSEEFSKFLRPAHGIYVTPFKYWASNNYGDGRTVILYANIRKIKKLDLNSEERDPFYDRDYEQVAKMLSNWSAEGYDCCQFGGESDSMVLFNNIDIVNAITGEPM